MHRKRAMLKRKRSRSKNQLASLKRPNTLDTTINIIRLLKSYDLRKHKQRKSTVRQAAVATITSMDYHEASRVRSKDSKSLS